MRWRMNYKAEELPEMLADLKSGTGLVVVRRIGLPHRSCAVLDKWTHFSELLKMDGVTMAYYEK